MVLVIFVDDVVLPHAGRGSERVKPSVTVGMAALLQPIQVSNSFYTVPCVRSDFTTPIVVLHRDAQGLCIADQPQAHRLSRFVAAELYRVVLHIDRSRRSGDYDSDREIV